MSEIVIPPAACPIRAAMLVSCRHCEISVSVKVAPRFMIPGRRAIRPRCDEGKSDTVLSPGIAAACGQTCQFERRR